MGISELLVLLRDNCSSLLRLSGSQTLNNTASCDAYEALFMYIISPIVTRLTRLCLCTSTCKLYSLLVLYDKMQCRYIPLSVQ